MKPEKILYAMNDIDNEFLNEARENTPAPRHSRKFVALIAAVIALMAITVTAFAAEEIAGWFRQYFTKQSEIPLTPGQIEFIEENEQVISETQSHNGYALELKSVLADTSAIYITLGITSPEALPIDEEINLSYDTFDFYDQSHKTPQALSGRMIDDGDGLDNTADVILEYILGSWNESDQWTLSIKELKLWIHDVAYEQDLLDTKYAGQKNFMLTDEESALAYRLETLVEGPWKFSIDLSKADSAALEMITKPITIQACCGFKPDGTLVYEERTINSLIIRPLSAAISAEPTESGAALDLTPTLDDQIFVVMKDGSRVPLDPDFGMMGTQHFTAASPIILDEVDHVLLSDGTKIMAP